MSDCTQLKAGDVVVLSAYGSPDALATIHRTTASQVMLRFVRGPDNDVYERVFRRKNGREVGSSGSWRAATIELATPEARKRIGTEQERRRLLDAVRAVKWGAQSNETLRRVMGIIEASE